VSPDSLFDDVERTGPAPNHPLEGKFTFLRMRR
jgi:hypothetical protein